MNLFEGAIAFGKVMGGTALELMKIGTWGTLNQYTNQQYKQSSTNLIGQVERGVTDQAKRLKIIKNN